MLTVDITANLALATVSSSVCGPRQEHSSTYSKIENHLHQLRHEVFRDIGCVQPHEVSLLVALSLHLFMPVKMMMPLLMLMIMVMTVMMVAALCDDDLKTA